MNSSPLVSVFDSVGFVGAFASRAAALGALAKYRGAPFLMHDLRAALPKGKKAPARVWAVPLKGGPLAFVFCSRARAATAHAALMEIDATFPDDVKYWECDFGVVIPAAARRLDNVQAVISKTKHSETDRDENKKKVAAFLSTLDGGGGEKPPQQDMTVVDLNNVPQKISILDDVIDTDTITTVPLKK